jgi:hypothetical protein
MTREQGRIIDELMDSIKRLQMRCSDLERAKLTIGKVVKCNIDNHDEQMMILGTYPTENGIVVKIADTRQQGWVSEYQWQDEPPKEDGDYFYTGKVPDGIDIVGIVQIFASPKHNKRMACIFIPPGWRGDTERKEPTVHFGEIEKWKGQWAGPEGGLCRVNYQPTGE